MKSFVPQYNVEYASLPIEDYEWYDTNHCVILAKKALAIKQVQHAAERPY